MEWLDSMGNATDMLLMANSATMGCNDIDDDVAPCQEPRREPSQALSKSLLQ